MDSGKRKMVAIALVAVLVVAAAAVVLVSGIGKDGYSAVGDRCCGQQASP